MKNTKTECKFFSIAEWEKEENYLREQHKNGWEFVRVNGFCLYHFKKCEPKDVVYRLDYNPDSITQKNTYVQLFSDCGWEYLQNYVGYSYFRKASSEMDESEEGIFCDDESRFDMIKRVCRGRLIPFLSIFFLVIIPQIFAHSHMNTPFNHFLLAFFSIMFVVYLLIFMTCFAIPLWKYYRVTHKK